MDSAKAVGDTTQDKTANRFARLALDFPSNANKTLSFISGRSFSCGTTGKRENASVAAKTWVVKSSLPVPRAGLLDRLALSLKAVTA